MFVKQSTHDKLKSEYDSLFMEFTTLAMQSNADIKEAKEAIDIINEKGGQKFLDHGVVIAPDQLKQLIVLCHPDKHQGKNSAVEATQFLLKIKKGTQ